MQAFSPLSYPMSQGINKNLDAIVKAYTEGKSGIVLEGGSRSGKTWSAMDFLLAVAANMKQPTVINIVKETYAGFKTTLFNDFNVRIPQFGLISPMANVKDVSSFNLFSTKFNLMGADQPSKYHGAGCDFFYINEALTISQQIFDQLEMRCTRFWIMDYNPSVSDHWIFNKLAKRDDVVFVHSTLLDNPFIGKKEKAKIRGYEPTPENIANGTADDYMWEVYGLGKRASPQGLIFKNVEWIDSFPDDCDQTSYGMDFGYTNSPTAVVKCGKVGNTLYLQKLFYTPVDNSGDLSGVLKPIVGDNHIWADSADPGMIAELRRLGVMALAVKKFPGSVKFGIDFLKSHKLVLVRDNDVRREQENYKWREVGGISLNEPVDDFNHFWDACRYACVSSFRRN